MAKQDKKVEELQALVQKKRAEVSSIDKATYNTNMLLLYNGARINLNTVSDLDELSSMIGNIVNQSQQYDEGRRILSLPSKDFKIGGYNAGDWIADIQTRVTKIQLSEKKKQLAKAEEVLNDLLSPDAKAKKALSSIEDMLNS